MDHIRDASSVARARLRYKSISRDSVDSVLSEMVSICISDKLAWAFLFDSLPEIKSLRFLHVLRVITTEVEI